VNCRNCQGSNLTRFLDLGTAPVSNGYLTKDQLSKSEEWIPLRVMICTDCWLAQTEDFITGLDVFTPDYAYFSSMSQSWLDHSAKYVAETVERFQLNETSFVVEIASNDGYLLSSVQQRGIPCLGIEPTASTAAAAREKGIETLEVFLNTTTAKGIVSSHGKADLVVANNVLAHVPDIVDFSKSLAFLLKPNGVLTVEFPRITTLIDQSQFDTVYHEHFSYLSLHSVISVFERADLEVFDVEELDTHGGSLRVFSQLRSLGKQGKSVSVDSVLAFELDRGIQTREYYSHIQSNAEKVKRKLLTVLLNAQQRNEIVAGYGAAAKGNTLLNYSGIRQDLLNYVVDRSESKIGKYLPGSRIPILNVDQIRESKPSTILVLPWNLYPEVQRQLAFTAEWGAELVIANEHIQLKS
jgi:SAM-dependent methyltransferase